MLKLLRSTVLGLATFLLVAFATGNVFAGTYGSDGYGKCEYSTGCSQHTIITTPSGLEIAVNLVDGQQIANDNGYDIVVTPLNGSGTSFQKVDIYINGKLVATVTPDNTGTATWHWDPQEFPGTVIKVVATDQDGKTVSKQFTIVLKSHPEQNGNSSGGGSTGSSSHGGGGILHPLYVLAANFVTSAKDIIKKLPQPVVVAFPYLLFIVILIEIGMLLIQTKRELHELHVLRKLLAQEREVSELKQGFLQLVSHYLRTPLTILRSGAEGLLNDGVRSEVAASIQQTATGLAATIEQIISGVDNAQSGAVVSGASQAITKHQTRQKIVVWLPVVLVGFFAWLFVYFANSVTKFDAGVVDIIIQVVTYVILATVLYQVWRRLHLHKRDMQDTRAVLADAAAVQASRDQVIHASAEDLKSYIIKLDQDVKQISPTATNGKFVTQGLSQLKVVQNEFLIATRLQGARSTAPLQTTTLAELYATATRNVAEAAQKKSISLSLASDVECATQSSALVALVLQTLLDNAVAYTSEGGKVEVSGQSDGTMAHIVVTDHGQGIPADKLSMLFQPFSKAEGAEVFTHEGMGFSLYLDKLIMTYLGGQIQIESEQGRGTQVGLSLAATLSPGRA